MQRGYDAVRMKLEKAKTYLSSCDNCRFFIDEECTNDKVTDYDITIDGDRTVCSYWKVYADYVKPERKKKKR